MLLLLGANQFLVISTAFGLLTARAGVWSIATV
jgi:hypothetical protein